MAQNTSEIRYLTPPSVEIKKKKICRLQRPGVFEKIPERAGKNSSPPYYRHFTEIPAQSGPGH